MTTLPRNSKKLAQVLAGAHNAVVYSNYNQYTAKPFEPETMTLSEHLTHTLQSFKSAKVTVNANRSRQYTLHYAPNLWWEFDSTI